MPTPESGTDPVRRACLVISGQFMAVVGCVEWHGGIDEEGWCGGRCGVWDEGGGGCREEWWSDGCVGVRR